MKCLIPEGAGKYALTIVRIALGVIFIMHGSQKVLGLWGGGGLTATVAAMTGMGLPAIIAYMVCFIELLGGLALFFGTTNNTFCRKSSLTKSVRIMSSRPTTIWFRICASAIPTRI
jgi:uncharacterized membrane protein YphA (DoxX/SURF4 family)